MHEDHHPLIRTRSPFACPWMSSAILGLLVLGVAPGFLDRLDGGDDEVERQQDQADADSHAPEIARARLTAAVEGNETSEHAHRRDGCHRECQHLDDEGGADVGAQRNG